MSTSVRKIISKQVKNKCPDLKKSKLIGQDKYIDDLICFIDNKIANGEDPNQYWEDNASALWKASFIMKDGYKLLEYAEEQSIQTNYVKSLV